MVFWGQLCRLPSDCTIKQIFMHILSHYTKNSHLQRGFIPDIYRLLGKYSLIHSLEQFMVTGNFLNKYRWKSIIREKLAIFTRQQYQVKSANSMSFKKFPTIHNSTSPYMLWDICKESPNYSKYARLATHLLGNMFTGARYYACHKCGQENAAQTKHLLMFCRCTEEFREHLWRKLIIRFGLGFFYPLHSVAYR